MRIFLFLPLLVCLFLNFNEVNYKLYGLLKINDDSFLTFCGSVSNTINAFAKILSGFVIDRVKVKNVLINVLIV